MQKAMSSSQILFKTSIIFAFLLSRFIFSDDSFIGFLDQIFIYNASDLHKIKCKRYIVGLF